MTLVLIVISYPLSISVLEVDREIIGAVLFTAGIDSELPPHAEIKKTKETIVKAGFRSMRILLLH